MLAAALVLSLSLSPASAPKPRLVDATLVSPVSGSGGDAPMGNSWRVMGTSTGLVLGLLSGAAFGSSGGDAVTSTLVGGVIGTLAGYALGYGADSSSDVPQSCVFAFDFVDVAFLLAALSLLTIIGTNPPAIP